MNEERTEKCKKRLRISKVQSEAANRKTRKCYGPKKGARDKYWSTKHYTEAKH